VEIVHPFDKSQTYAPLTAPSVIEACRTRLPS
jgi:hypothetical protein